MPEIGPEHPLSYRREIVEPLFRAIRAGESCAIVGAASMGKSRLLHFILRSDVQQHYLGEEAGSFLIALVDGNRLAELSEWGLYELLLTALTETSGQHPAGRSLRAEFVALRREVITSGNALLARRHVELAAHMLCREQGLRLCFLLDEFDELYRAVPPLALANLRALRDANKYWLCYIPIMREHPARVRPPSECEGFYELFSRIILGLTPYTRADAERVLQQLEARKDQQLPQAARAQLLRLSGGHPGLMVALFDALIHDGIPQPRDWEEWALSQPTIQEECSKLWGSLATDERVALTRLVHGGDTSDYVRRVLELKGLVCVQNGRVCLFSPLFARFSAAQSPSIEERLRLDEATRILWIGDRVIKNLTAREFDLVAFLYRRLGEVCTRDQIIAHLYADAYQSPEAGVRDNRVDTLVRRVRRKIEPVPKRPRYLITVRGKGFKLVDLPGTEK